MLRFMVRILGMHGKLHIVSENKKLINMQVGGI